MLLTLGTRLAPYEISAPLGAGGMGEVFSARDDAPGAERSAAQAALARVHARLGRRDEALTEWEAFLGLPHDPGDSLTSAAELARAGIPR